MRLGIWNRRTAAVVCAALACVMAAALVVRERRWKRFATVAPGKVYRSGQLRTTQLASAIRELKLSTVICLNPENVAAERALCEKQGVGFFQFPMPADGHGEAEQFAEVVKLLRDPHRQPALVHCFSGVARTGASVALYRMMEDGWEQEKAIAELASFERRGTCLPELREHVHQVAGRIAERR